MIFTIFSFPISPPTLEFFKPVSEGIHLGDAVLEEYRSGDFFWGEVKLGGSYDLGGIGGQDGLEAFPNLREVKSAPC